MLCISTPPIISSSLKVSFSQNANLSTFSYDEDIIVYTANQGFFSRIYILNMSGSVLNYFEYENFRFCDTEVVNNNLYVAEAFAPRVEKVRNWSRSELKAFRLLHSSVSREGEIPWRSESFRRQSPWHFSWEEPWSAQGPRPNVSRYKWIDGVGSDKRILVWRRTKDCNSWEVL